MINNKLIEKWLTDNLITESQAQVMLSDIEVYRNCLLYTSDAADE